MHTKAETIESTMDFDTLMRRRAQSINYIMERILESQPVHGRLKDSLKYTLSAPGKRIRALLVLWGCEVISGHINHNAEIAAAAIEMVHTYSLIHDDLPAMDDDDVRRGVPTCHKEFDEATAILTGDALLTMAFEVLAKGIEDPHIAVKLIRELAQNAGPGGMIGGQMADLRAEKSEGTEDLLEYIHVNKTAKIFRCAAVMGGLCAKAGKKQLDALNEFGMKIGLAFQITDDILDVSASSEQLGKTAGKDVKASKCTYPAVLGMDRAKQVQRQLTEDAIAQLKPFGKKADMLRHLAVKLMERTK
jgi:geranylgeranyl diphosphate synthase type II